MEHSDWDDRWREGRIGFHQAQVSDLLLKYADQLWGDSSLGRVFVPLCGKSLDMVFLAERADEIVGVEYVRQAVAEFFDEQDLQAEVGGSPERWSAANYRLYSCDFFALTPDEIGPIDAVFDRASLVAMDGPARIRYANHLTSLLPAGARMLLVTFDYDQAEMAGPPFAVSLDEVEQLFGSDFDIEVLESRDGLNDRFRAKGLTRFSESAVRLVRR